MRSDCKIRFLITSSWDIETTGTVSNIPLLKINLGPPDVKESVQVLKNAANLTSPDTEPNTEVKLREIAALCENIPLALRLAGPLLAVDSEYTFEELKLKLEKNPTSTLGLKPIMEIAFEKLDESLQRALVSLSVFPQSFKRDAAAAILGDNCAEALTNLKKRCLIQKQGDRYLIHFLIRSYAKQIGQRKEFGQILADGKLGYLRHFLSVILRNAQVYWAKDTCKESLKLFNEERMNLEFILREVAIRKKKLQNCKELEDVVDSCSQVAPYIEDCVPFKLYGDFLNGLLQCSRSQEKITKQVEILCLLYDESRRHGGEKEKSKDLIDQAIKLHESHLPAFEQNSLSEAFYLSHYGRYLSQECEMRVQAQPLLEKAISIVRKETFDIGRVLGQMGHNARLGKLHNNARYEEALTYFQKALDFRQCHYGEHVVTALAHKDVAGIFLSIEDFGKAEENYEAVVQIFESMGMMKQKEAIPNYKNFARCCEKSGKIDEARRKLEMAIKVADTTIEGSHNWKVEINTNLALILYKNYPHEVSKADQLSKEVFCMAKKLKIEKWYQSEKLKPLYKKK